MTIEDETGFANLVVEPTLAHRDRVDLHGSLILAVGRLEYSDGVVNMCATRLRSLEIGPLEGEQPIKGVPSHDHH